MKKISTELFNILATHADLNNDEKSRARYCVVEGNTIKSAATKFRVTEKTIRNAINKVLPKRKTLTKKMFDHAIKHFNFSEKKINKIHKVLVENKRIVDVTKSASDSSNLSRACNLVLEKATNNELVTITVTVHASQIKKVLELESQNIPTNFTPKTK